MNKFREYARMVSHNHTRTAWILKCDIRKFFANIDHKILIDILKKNIPDADAVWLLKQIITSFSSTASGRGLPLGNLTSQLLVNIYMNEFDQFLKRKLKVRSYVRYADDFMILHENRSYVETLIPNISAFLETQLGLSLHPHKIFIKTFSSGVDFLGWVHFPHHRTLRTATKKRVFKRLNRSPIYETVASYRGLLAHGSTHKLQKRITENKKFAVSAHWASSCGKA